MISNRMHELTSRTPQSGVRLRLTRPRQPLPATCKVVRVLVAIGPFLSDVDIFEVRTYFKFDTREGTVIEEIASKGAFQLFRSWSIPLYFKQSLVRVELYFVGPRILSAPSVVPCSTLS